MTEELGVTGELGLTGELGVTGELGGTNWCDWGAGCDRGRLSLTDLYTYIPIKKKGKVEFFVHFFIVFR